VGPLRRADQATAAVGDAGHAAATSNKDRRRNPVDRTVGLKEVAELAGVSMRTVSNVVRGTGRASASTRARVQRAVDELGYRPNAAARGLRTGRSGVLSLAVPGLNVPYFAELADIVMREAALHGCTVLVECTEGRPETELRIALGHGDQLVDGVILSPLALDQEAVAEAAELAPLVLLGERVHDLPCTHVMIDNEQAAREATEHLLSLGRRRVAVIGRQQSPHAETSRVRMAGYRAALAAAGREYDEALAPEVTWYGRADGAAAMASLLGLGPWTEPGAGRAGRPDAVFCFADVLAEGAMHAVREAGLRIPEDVAFVGFDDLDQAAYAAPPLTSVAPDKQQLARLAVAELLDRIEAGPDGPPGTTTVRYAPHHLVVRRPRGAGRRPGNTPRTVTD
jgi:DNA-binding LacI/PurR family transcriptional regulator